jgi:hypothetical protein
MRRPYDGAGSSGSQSALVNAAARGEFAPGRRPCSLDWRVGGYSTVTQFSMFQ